MTFSTASLSSYDEFFTEWYPKAVRAASKRGVRDPEAAAADIMLLFFEKDYLDRYDPAMAGAVSLKNWIMAIVTKRVTDVQRYEARRLQPANTEKLPEQASDEVTVSVPEFRVMAMEAFQLIKRRYGQELSDVWVSVVKQVVEGDTAKSGVVRLYLIAEHLKIRRDTAATRVEELRSVLLSDPDLRELVGADHWSREAA